MAQAVAAAAAAVAAAAAAAAMAAAALYGTQEALPRADASFLHLGPYDHIPLCKYDYTIA